MNNLFNTYNTNLYNEKITKTVNITGTITLELVRKIVGIEQPKNLTKFLQHFININYDKIVDARVIALLGLYVISFNHTSMSLTQIINDGLKQHNLNRSTPQVSEIFISEIITNLSYRNRDQFARSQLKSVITSNFGNNSSLFPDDNFIGFGRRLPIQEHFTQQSNVSANKFYYLNVEGDETLHQIRDIKTVELSPNVSFEDLKGFSQKQITSYVNNNKVLYTIIEIIDEQLKHNKALRENAVAKLVNIKGIIKHIYEKKLLLLSTYIDMTSLISHLLNNDIKSLSDINKLVNNVSFDQIAKNIKELDLKSINPDELVSYAKYVFRNVTADDLRGIVNFDKILADLYSLSIDDYLLFIGTIVSSIELSDYSALSQENKNDMINSLNNVQLNKLLNKVKLQDLTKYINMDKFENLIKKIGFEYPTSSSVMKSLEDNKNVVYDIDYSLLADNVINSAEPETTLKLINKILNKIF